jgi:hypothetical protein
MLMSFTKFKMDEITGERVSMTHLKIYYRFEHMFFNKAAKESWQMLSSGSLQTVQAYANLKKAILIAFQLRGGNASDVIDKPNPNPVTLTRFKTPMVKKGKYPHANMKISIIYLYHYPAR